MSFNDECNYNNKNRDNEDYYLYFSVFDQQIFKSLSSYKFDCLYGYSSMLKVAYLRLHLINF